MDKNRAQHSARVLLLGLVSMGLIAYLVGTSLVASEKSEADNAACLECHQDQADNLVGSKHALTSAAAKGTDVTCIACHGDWEKHLEDPDANKPVVSSKLAFAAQAKLCASCHQGEHQTSMLTTDPHGRAGLDCATCHTVHGNGSKGLVKDDSENYCATCHSTVMAQFGARSAHPLHDGNIQCLDCHSMSDRKDQMLATGFDFACQSCHSDYAGPHVFEHPVTSTHLVEGGGCIECHSPHGSPNERLLTQPENGTCLQCHGMPSGHRSAHSGMATRIECVNCHSEFHGSNDNRLFLDPMLTTTFYANCYASGCHDNLKK